MHVASRPAAGATEVPASELEPSDGADEAFRGGGSCSFERIESTLLAELNHAATHSEARISEVASVASSACRVLLALRTLAS